MIRQSRAAIEFCKRHTSHPSYSQAGHEDDTQEQSVPDTTVQEQIEALLAKFEQREERQKAQGKALGKGKQRERRGVWRA